MTSVDAQGVTFRLTDRQRRLSAVTLAQELGVPGPLPFERAGADWTLRLDRPDVDRMEYLFEVADRNGNRWTIPDPANPNRAPGAFGEKSVVEFDGYRRPEWLDGAAVDAEVTEHVFPMLDATMTVTLWSPSGLDAGTPAPLLAVHDGPEFVTLGGLGQYLGVSVAAGVLPPLRVALLDPGDRNVWYSADDGYAATLCRDVLPALSTGPAPATVTIGMGASLGGLAMLHAHRTQPGVLDALFLQSSSFFTPELDPQESGFSGYAAITGFTAAVHAATRDPAPVPTVLTCGTVEENLGNNVSMGTTLGRLGYDVRLHRVRDAHNFTAWRDALHPRLTGLIERACSRPVDHAT